jgi:hypothetical protein
MTPLLQSPAINPHATLITLFMNVVEEEMTDEDRISNTLSRMDMLRYMESPNLSTGKNDRSSFSCLMMAAAELGTSYDCYFDRYVPSEK